MKYLVMKVRVNRFDEREFNPVCETDDISEYGDIGYCIIEIKKDGTMGKTVKYADVFMGKPRLVVYTFKEDVEEDYEGNSDINIIESFEIENNDIKKIVESNLFKNLTKRYLAISYDNAKKFFVSNYGCVSNEDVVDCEMPNEYYIALKDKTGIARNY